MNIETLANRRHGIIKRIRPLDREVVSEGDLHPATLRIDHLDADIVDEIQQFWGQRSVSLSLVMEGMAFILPRSTLVREHGTISRELCRN